MCTVTSIISNETATSVISTLSLHDALPISAAAAAGAELEVIDAEALTVLAGRTAGESVVARSKAERPDALFCVNDLLAVGVLQAFAFRHQVEIGRADVWTPVTWPSSMP